MKIKRLILVLLCFLITFSGMVPAFAASQSQGVEGDEQVEALGTNETDDDISSSATDTNDEGASTTDTSNDATTSDNGSNDNSTTEEAPGNESETPPSSGNEGGDTGGTDPPASEPDTPVENPDGGSDQGNSESEPPPAEEPTNEGTDPEEPNPDESTNEPTNPEDETTTEDPEALPEEDLEALPEEEEALTEEEELEAARGDLIRGPITENIITNFRMTLLNGDPLPDPMPNPADQTLNLAVFYEFALPDLKYGAGSTFTFQLPNVFAVFNAVSGSLADTDGTVLGSFTLDTNRTVVLTFNEEIETRSNVTGTVRFQTEIRKDLTGDTDQEIIVPVGPDGGQTVVIPITFKPKVARSVDKRGVPNRSFNAETIAWEVDFNKEKNAITNAVLEDPILSELGTSDFGNQKLQGNVELYYLNVQLDGTVTQGGLVPSSEYTLTATDNLVKVAFNGTITDAYRLKFTTEITEDTGVRYRNTATLKGDGLTNLTASATVSTGRGQTLQKRAVTYDNVNQTVSWEVKLNYNQRQIPAANTVVTDYFDSGQSLISDTFKVERITLNVNGQESGSTVVDPSEYSVTPDTQQSTNRKGFRFQFNSDINEAYKITYKTSFDERLLANGTARNSVSFSDKTSEVSQGVQQGVLLKSANSPNYRDKNVQWTIRINRDKQEMKEVVLTDVFTNGGLTFLPNTFALTGITPDKYTLTVDDATQGFKIVFNEPVTNEIVITYRTAFDYEARINKNNQLINTANVVWKDKNDVDRTLQATATFTPDTFTRANGFKGGSYNAVTKEITWNVGLNYNLQTITDVVFRDTVQGDQTILPNSIQIFEGTLGTGQNSLTKGANVTANFSPQVNGQEISINFGSINRAYIVEFKTSLDDKIISATYPNRAEISYAESEQKISLPATVSVANGGKYTGKTGRQNGLTMEWTITLNAGQSTLQGPVKVRDILSNNQIILEDELVVYSTTVSANGNFSKGAALTRGTDYTVEFKEIQGQPAFDLIFPDGIDTVYIIEYKSFLQAADNDTVSNNANLFITNPDFNGDTDDSHSQIVRITTGAGSATGVRGDLTIKKQGVKDTFEGQESTGFLPGATFSLYDKTKQFRIKTGTTDENGVLTFTNIAYGEYMIKEDSAPDGYAVRAEYTPVTLSNNTDPIIIKNDKIIGDVALTKTDTHGKTTLQGATFSLYRVTGEERTVVGSNLKTDANGRIEVTDLEPGTYEFIETEAAPDYKLDDTPVSFTIKKNQITVIELDKENELIRGSVKLTKVDRETKDKLENAVFRLVDADGEILGYYTTNENGIIIVEDLLPGNYAFEEATAPFGFTGSTDRIAFEIVRSQTERLELVFDNDIITGSFTLLKLEGEREKALEGAVFSLLTADGDVLIEELTTDENGEITVTNVRPGSYKLVETKAPIGYILDDTPIVFTVTLGGAEELFFTKDNKIKKADVIIIKVDRETEEALAGAEFTLADEDGNVIEYGITTDETGRATIKELRPGTYKLVETSAPDHYEENETVHTITIPFDPEDEIEYTVENDIILGGVKLTKVDEGNSRRVLQNAVFNILDEEGEVVRSNLTTNSDGVILVDDLRPGNYSFVETRAPGGYVLDRTPKPFTVEKSQEALVEITATNRLIRGSVQITKTDKDSNTPLAGVVFDLVSSGGTTIQANLVTDQFGVVAVSNLLPGRYGFKEVRALEGYTLNSTIQWFDISSSQSGVVRLAMSNELVKGQLEIVKFDGDTGETLEGVTFTLLDADRDVVESGLVTNADGRIVVDNLAPGTYYVQEVDALEGYVLNEEAVEVTIPLGATAPVRVEIDNFKTRGELTIIKHVAGDTDARLPDAVFTIDQLEGRTFTTDANGEISIDDLLPGDYLVTETTAPDGYVLSEEQYVIRITLDDLAPVLFVANEPIDDVPPPDDDVDEEVDPPPGEEEEPPGDNDGGTPPDDVDPPDDPEVSPVTDTPGRGNNGGGSGGTDSPSTPERESGSNFFLPQTGYGSMWLSITIALFAMSLGAVFLRRRRRTEQ
ncbi:LPXTG cell wall anchor domain-containing protein [Paenalkalicoccus suaedae]|uniref:LPXTG cell wall anchor domain-containing protein n=1 Tax=Paenalkalicoccus suaedae TaxID=2592382 RepID=A0A859FIE9_9BACI|nr:SpaA isopeptide-forming pilin-related protein [Paenalkalicoccus suaedae]QKS72620.1 LPXTG cell wall anchor domain-containing protein [Paenalkalicoccus suaedae]